MKRVHEITIAFLLIPIAVPGYIMWCLICCFSTARTFWDADAFRFWFSRPQPVEKLKGEK
jgi:hypothetical protein